VLECGEASIRFCPPLIVDSPAVDRAVEIFGAALRAVHGPLPGMQETGG
jgi:4-aminobutyrate aminotransferase-like enzyme